MSIQDVQITDSATDMQVTSKITLKRITAYFKKTDRVHVQRLEDSSFLLSDGKVMVNVPMHADLLPYAFFPANWERATFKGKDTTPEESGPDALKLWERLHAEETVARLTLTHHLYEVAGARNTPGVLYRKLFYCKSDSSEEIKAWVDKRMMDMLSPDIEEVEGFMFERTAYGGAVRVYAVNGIVAYMMPATIEAK